MVHRSHSVISWGEQGRMFEIKVVLENLGRVNITYMLFKMLTMGLMHKMCI